MNGFKVHDLFKYLIAIIFLGFSSHSFALTKYVQVNQDYTPALFWGESTSQLCLKEKGPGSNTYVVIGCLTRSSDPLITRRHSAAGLREYRVRECQYDSLEAVPPPTPRVDDNNLQMQEVIEGGQITCVEFSIASYSVYAQPGTPTLIGPSGNIEPGNSYNISWGTASGLVTASAVGGKIYLERKFSGGNYSPITNKTAAGSFPDSQTQTGTYTYRVRACNSNLCSNYRTLSVVVKTPNGKPVLSSISNITGRPNGKQFTTTVTASDPNSVNVLTFSLPTKPTGMSISKQTSTTAKITWTPNSTGTFPVVVRVTDNGSPVLSDDEAFSIGVVNNSPVINNIPNFNGWVQGQKFTTTVTASDPNPGDILTFSLPTKPTGMSISKQTDTTAKITWTPGVSSSTPFQVKVSVTDDGNPNLSDDEAFSIEVIESNHPPVLNSIANVSGWIRGQTFTQTLVATDSNAGDILTFNLVTAPSGMNIAKISATSAKITWTPTNTGSFSVKVKVSDNGVGRLNDEKTFSIEVIPPNSAPKLYGMTLSGSRITLGQSISVQASVSDVDNNLSSFRICYSTVNSTGSCTPIKSCPTANAAAGINCNSGNWTPSQARSYYLWYEASDGQFSPKSAISRLIVDPPNLPPTAAIVAPSANTTYKVGDTVSINVDAADSDGDIKSVTFYTNGSAIHTANLSCSAAVGATRRVTYNWPVTIANNYDLSVSATDCEGDSGGASTLVPIVVEAYIAPAIPSVFQFIENDVPVITSTSGNYLVQISPVSGGDIYQLYENTDQVSGNILPANLTKGISNKPSGTYCYCARAATNTNANPLWSTIGTGNKCKTVTVERPLPSIPDFNVIDLQQTGRFSLTWSDNGSDTSYYKLHHKQGGVDGIDSGNWLLLADSLNQLTFTVINANIGLSSYQLTACNSENQCQVGQQLTVNTLAPYIEDADANSCGDNCLNINGLGFDEGAEVILAKMEDNSPLVASDLIVSSQSVKATIGIDVQTAIASFGVSIIVRNPNQSSSNFVLSSHAPNTRPSLTNAALTLGNNGVIYATSGNQLLALDMFTGDYINGWPQTLDGVSFSQPAINGQTGDIYVGTVNKQLHAFSPQGALQWKTQLRGAMLAGAVLDETPLIYQGTLDAALYAINPNGNIEWQYPVSAGIAQRPTLYGNGLIYVTSQDGVAHVIDRNNLGPYALRWNDSINCTLPMCLNLDLSGWQPNEEDIPNGQLFVVGRLFYAILGRSPGERELTFWAYAVREGASHQEIVGAFLQSPEGLARFPTTMPDDAFLRALYGKLFYSNWPETVDGLSYDDYLALLVAGSSRAEVTLMLTNSLEYGGLIDNTLHQAFFYLYDFCVLVNDCTFFGDSDGDGISDQDEWDNGLNPLDPADGELGTPYLEVTTVNEQGHFTLSWENISGADFYQVDEAIGTGNFIPIEQQPDTNIQTLTREAGDYRYRIRACVAGTTGIIFCVSQYSNTVNLVVADLQNLEWSQTGGTVDDSELQTVTIPVSNFNGAVPGQASVNGSAASYNIPITLPPGRNGMQPEVSLNYNSRSGNGIVGIGWSLSAGSSINRCNATEAQNKFTAAVQYDSVRDRLCIDGQRLVVVNGATYGSSGAVYRTEMDSFIQVIQSGSINGTSTSFTVADNNGRTHYYGTTADSRHSAEGVSYIFSWALANTTDSAGNTIIYDYVDLGEGEQLLSAIHYTGYANTQGNRHVRFDYQAKEQFSTAYMAGGKTRLTKRLYKIQTEYGASKVREYTLNYTASESSERDLLRSVQVCAYDAAQIEQCYRSTTFDWQENTPQYVFEKLQYNDGAGWVAMHEDLPPEQRELRFIMPFGDTNGDGVRDWQGAYVNAEGEKTGDNDVQLTHCYFAANSFSVNCPTADFNNDGKTDNFRQQNGQLQIKYTGTDGWFDSNIVWEENLTHLNNPLAFTDMNGDGWVDIVFKHHIQSVGYSQLYIYLHSKNASAPYSTSGSARQLVYAFPSPSINGGIYKDAVDLQLPGDLDGNGIVDFVVFDTQLPNYDGNPSSTDARHAPGTLIPGRVFLVTSNSNGAVTIDKTSRKFTGHIYSETYSGNFLHDINGDGLVDWLNVSADSANLLYRLNTGTDFASTWQDLGVRMPMTQVEYQSGPTEWEYYITAAMNKVMMFDYDGDGTDEFLIASGIEASSCQYAGVQGIYHWYCDDSLYGNYRHNSLPFGPSIASDRFDNSVRKFDVIKFSEDAAGNIIPSLPQPTDILASAFQKAVVDATGDGLPDIVTMLGCRFADDVCRWNDPTDNHHRTDLTEGAYINRNKGAAQGSERYAAYDLLKSVNNGAGIQSEWIYKPLSHGKNGEFYSLDPNAAVDEEHFHFASSMYAVKEFTQTNGIGGNNSVQYRYSGAMFNTQGRGFRGFKTITEVDVAGATTTHTQFKQKFPFSSLVERQQEFAGTDVNVNSASPFNVTINDWQINPQHIVAGVYNLYNAQAQNSIYDVNSLLQISQSMNTIAFDEIDQFGNIREKVTEITDEYGVYTTVEVADFSQATIDWPHRYRSHTVTRKAVERAGKSGIAVDAGTDTDKIVKTEVDWEETLRKPDTVRIKIGSAATLITSNTTHYNAYGLPWKVDITGNVLEGITDRSFSQIRSIETTYSDNGTVVSDSGYFPYRLAQKASATVDHITIAETDPRTGLAHKVTDITGVVSQTQYDSLGRAVQIDQTGTPSQYIAYQTPDDYAPDDNLAVMMVKTVQMGTPQSAQYLDPIGRTVRTRTQGFDGNHIYQDKRYNTRGLTSRESTPHSGTPVFTQYGNFDVLGRVGTKIAPQTNGVLTTSYTYDGLSTDIHVVPSLGATLDMSRTYNSLNQLVKTVDAQDGLTQYAYDGGGNPIVIQDAADNRIIASYDALGRKRWVKDPNQGLTGFTYNDFGELEKEVDGNNAIIRYDGDLLGRVTRRSADNTANFVWDSGKKGLLSSESAPGISKHYQYDSSARPTAVITNIDGTPYTVGTEYDANYGRVKALKYPEEGIVVKLEYNPQGYLSKEVNAQSDFVYREVTAQDNFGNIQNALMNNGNLAGTYLYHSTTGQMLSTWVQRPGGEVKHYLDYQLFDSYGNLKTQRNWLTNSSERFNYDSLHRLDDSSLSIGGISSSIDYAYDVVGNIKKKSDYSANDNNAYAYAANSNKLQQVTLKDNSVVTFAYDVKGNQTHRNSQQEVTYNSFNKPISISKNGSNISLHYGADLARYKQMRVVAGKTITTHYIDKRYEVEIESGNRTRKTYISDVAIVTHSDTVGQNIVFTHKDRLGSSATMTDHNDQVLTRRHFDPFGKPRAGDWSALESIGARAQLRDNPLDMVMTTRRGFTDHEHLDEAELIHMNGRVYDYNLGRFMSVDPFIQSPTNSQSMNPYSYIMNNPMSGTDPTGYCGTRIAAKGASSCKTIYPNGKEDSTSDKAMKSGSIMAATAAARVDSNLNNGTIKGALGKAASAKGLQAVDIGSLGRGDGGGSEDLYACTNCEGSSSPLDGIDMPEDISEYERDKKAGENGYPSTEYLNSREIYHEGLYDGDSEILISGKFETYLNENPRFGISYNYDLPNAWRMRLPNIVFTPEVKVDVYNVHVNWRIEKTPIFDVKVYRQRIRMSAVNRVTDRTFVQTRWIYTKEFQNVDTKIQYFESRRRGGINQTQSWPIVP